MPRHSCTHAFSNTQCPYLMNLRAYLTILRPVRTLLFAAFYSWAVGFNLLKVAAGQSTTEAAFFTFTILGPIILGAFLIGPIHEVMHRSFSAVLPNARLSLLRWHLLAIGIAALSLYLAVAFSGFSFPHAASLGLILVCLAVPLLNRRQALGSAYFLPFAGYLALGLFLALPTRSLLLDAGRSLPWAFFVVGIGSAVLCFRSGFSAEGMCTRSRSPQLVCCFQTSLPFFGSAGLALTRYAQAQNGRLLTARQTGRDWTVAVVGASLREWVAVVHHCRFGGTRLGQHLLGLLIVGLSPLGCIALIQFFISRADPRNAVPFSEICGLLAESFRVGNAPDQISTLFFLFAPLFALIVPVTLLTSVAFTPYHLPLSRHRLAHCVHLEALRLNGLITALFSLELLGIALGATVLAGLPIAWAYLGRPLAAALLLLPASFFTQAFIYWVARYRWLLIGGPMLLVIVGSGLAGAFVARLGNRALHFSPVVLLDAVLTPTGLLGCLVVTAIAIALSWLALHRHFRTCDLARPLPWVARTA